MSEITHVWIPEPALGTICPFCGFERREGDAHLVYFDPMPSATPGGLPTFGCGIAVVCHTPQRLAVISSSLEGR